MFIRPVGPVVHPSQRPAGRPLLRGILARGAYVWDAAQIPEAGPPPGSGPGAWPAEPEPDAGETGAWAAEADATGAPWPTEAEAEAGMWDAEADAGAGEAWDAEEWTPEPEPPQAPPPAPPTPPAPAPAVPPAPAGPTSAGAAAAAWPADPAAPGRAARGAPAGPGGTSAGAGGPDLMLRLAQLADLAREGLLTPAEYAAAKSRLLNP